MADLREKLAAFSHRHQDVLHPAPEELGSRVTAYEDEVSAQSVGADASCATMWPSSRQSGRPNFGPIACRPIDVRVTTKDDHIDKMLRAQPGRQWRCRAPPTSTHDEKMGSEIYNLETPLILSY